ncbi:MAG: formylmethanofuran dehydrogenase [Proteobacteria bacterium]|nr:formylmethanofuran dehydrogenase [Pseudomonadota bacterium]
MNKQFSEELNQCISFHGHLCPGLIYGYLVAQKASELLHINRSKDEEIVAVCENDSCAVDALQVILGTSSGKGNLIIQNYGKNAFTIFSRSEKKAYRFSRTTTYAYTGLDSHEFQMLEKKVADGTATIEEKKRQKYLKAIDLIEQPFEAVFKTEETAYHPPDYAPLAPSKPCGLCGEMTMSTRMVSSDTHGLLCIPCSYKRTNLK